MLISIFWNKHKDCCNLTVAMQENGVFIVASSTYTIKPFWKKIQKNYWSRWTLEGTVNHLLCFTYIGS